MEYVELPYLGLLHISLIVEYNGAKSNYLKITCGIPQGSILGPVLFLLYINDIISASKILQLILFADDTNIFLSDVTLDRLLTTVNKELRLLTYVIGLQLTSCH